MLAEVQHIQSCLGIGRVEAAGFTQGFFNFFLFGFEAGGFGLESIFGDSAEQVSVHQPVLHAYEFRKPLLKLLTAELLRLTKIGERRLYNVLEDFRRVPGRPFEAFQVRDDSIFQIYFPPTQGRVIGRLMVIRATVVRMQIHASIFELLADEFTRNRESAISAAEQSA